MQHFCNARFTLNAIYSRQDFLWNNNTINSAYKQNLTFCGIILLSSLTLLETIHFQLWSLCAQIIIVELRSSNSVCIPQTDVVYIQNIYCKRKSHKFLGPEKKTKKYKCNEGLSLEKNVLNIIKIDTNNAMRFPSTTTNDSFAYDLESCSLARSHIHRSLCINYKYCFKRYIEKILWRK